MSISSIKQKLNKKNQQKQEVEEKNNTERKYTIKKKVKPGETKIELTTEKKC